MITTFLHHQGLFFRNQRVIYFIKLLCGVLKEIIVSYIRHKQYKQKHRQCKEIHLYRNKYQRQQKKHPEAHRHYEMDKPFVLIKAYPDKKLFLKILLVFIGVCRLFIYIFIIFFDLIFHKIVFFPAYYNAL